MEEPKIIYEDKDFLILNKPAGLLVHSTKIKNQERALTDWLLENYPQVKSVGDDPENRPGIVHRLDKETSGVIVVALNQPSFEYLKNLFQTHQVKKIYVALVWGVLKQNSGVINKPIGLISGTTRRSVLGKNMKMVKEAITNYEVVKLVGEDKTLLRVEPKTGRTHQIRVHLASIGHPIVGDKIYGKRKLEKGLVSMYLHAETIEFPLLSGNLLRVSADLPNSFKSIVEQ